MRIAVFNQKGGVGKTTTALNLAAAVSRDDRQSLLVDLSIRNVTFPAFSATHRRILQKSLFAYYQDLKSLGQLEIEWEGLGGSFPRTSN